MMDENFKIKKRLLNLQIKYHSLFEESREFIYSSFPNGKIININLAGVKSLGYTSKEELIDRTIVDFYYNPLDRKYFNKSITRYGYLKDFEIILKRKNGKKLIGLETTSAVKNEAGKIVEYIGIIKDHTDRIKNELVLRRKNAEIEHTCDQLKMAQEKIIRQEKLASIGQLAAGIAHEINNPLGFIRSDYNTLKKYLNSISLYFQGCEKFFHNLDRCDNKDFMEEFFSLKESKKKLKIEYIMNDINDIFKESAEGFSRILSIIKGLMDFARVDSEKKYAQYDLNAAIENTLIVARNEVKYVAEITTDFKLVPLIYCIPGEINQVILNIIINAAQALKFMKKNESGKINIKTYTESRFVCCEISDTGPGIPANIINKIFDPFFTTKDVGVGTGLGLSISFDIIKTHKGELAVESNPGQGSTFIIKLPFGE